LRVSRLRCGPADDAEAYRSLGNVLMRERRWEAAQAAMEQAAALRPQDPDKFASLVYLRQNGLRLANVPADLDRLWTDATRQLAQVRHQRDPLQALTLPWPMDRLLPIARSHSQAIVQQQSGGRQALGLTHARAHPGRLRIGYLSGDFYDHPVGHLLKDCLGRHERAHFEVFVYSFGPRRWQCHRRRIAAECEHFCGGCNPVRSPTSLAGSTRTAFTS